MSYWASIQEVADKYSVDYETIRRAYKNGRIPQEALRELPGNGKRPIVRIDLDLLDEAWKPRRRPGRPPSTRFSEEEVT